MDKLGRLLFDAFGWMLSAPFLIFAGIVLFFLIFGIINERRKR